MCFFQFTCFFLMTFTFQYTYIQLIIFIYNIQFTYIIIYISIFVLYNLLWIPYPYWCVFLEFFFILNNNAYISLHLYGKTGLELYKTCSFSFKKTCQISIQFFSFNNDIGKYFSTLWPAVHVMSSLNSFHLMLFYFGAFFHIYF